MKVNRSSSENPTSSNPEFIITAVSREDLEEKGFDTSEVSDEQMGILASKMADDYLEQLYWISLVITAEYLGIPKKNQSTTN